MTISFLSLSKFFVAQHAIIVVLIVLSTLCGIFELRRRNFTAIERKKYYCRQANLARDAKQCFIKEAAIKRKSQF